MDHLSIYPPKMDYLSTIPLRSKPFSKNSLLLLPSPPSLSLLPFCGRMTALLGDMYELGVCSDAAHESVGIEFARKGGAALYTYGKLADMIARGAVLGGMSNEDIFRNLDVKRPDISGEMLLKTLRAGDTLLVKASRAAKAEDVIEYLKENEARLRH